MIKKGVLFNVFSCFLVFCFCLVCSGLSSYGLAYAAETSTAINSENTSGADGGESSSSNVGGGLQESSINSTVESSTPSSTSGSSPPEIIVVPVYIYPEESSEDESSGEEESIVEESSEVIEPVDILLVPFEEFTISEMLLVVVCFISLVQLFLYAFKR